MPLGSPWKRDYRGRLTAYAFAVVVIALSILYLLLNPQHFILFLAVTTAALVFVVAMFFLPRYRERLVRGILAYQTKSREVGGWSLRYWKAAVAIVAIETMLFPFVVPLVSQQYLPYFVLVFLAVLLTAGSVVIAGFLRTTGKWGCLLVLLIFVIVFVAVFALHLARAPGTGVT